MESTSTTHPDSWNLGALDGACTLLPRFPSRALPAEFAVLLVPFSSFLEAVLTIPLPPDKDIMFFLIWESKAVHIPWGLGGPERGSSNVCKQISQSPGQPRGSWSRYLSLPSLQSPPHLYPASWLLCSLPRILQQAKNNASHLCGIVTKR